MFFHLFYLFFSFFPFFFKLFTTNSLSINSKIDSLAFLKPHVSKSNYNNFSEKKKALEYKKENHEYFEKGKLKEKKDSNTTKKKKNQNEVKSKKKNNNKSFKKNYDRKPFKKFYNNLKKDKEIIPSEKEKENEGNKEKETREKKAKKKFFYIKKGKKKKKKDKKEEKILNMFQNNLNYSIEKLNKRTRKYEHFKENENLKNNILKNEILQKILGKDSSSTIKEKKKIFIDDISDNNNNIHENENKKKNNKVNFMFENNGNDNNSFEKRKNKKQKNSEKYCDFKKFNHTNKKNENVGQEKKFLEKKDPLINNDKEENYIKRISKKNNNSKKKNSGIINMHLEKDEKHEKRKMNEAKVIYEIKEKKKSNQTKKENEKIYNEKKNEKKNNEILCSEKRNNEYINEEVDNEKNNTNIEMQNILKIGSAIDNFRKEIIILENNNKEYDSIKNKLLKFNSIIDFNANKFVEKKKKEKSNRTFNFKEVGIFDNFINVYLKYNNIKNTTEYQKEYIPMILFFMNNSYSDFQNCFHCIKQNKLLNTENTDFVYSKEDDASYLEIQNNDNQKMEKEEFSCMNIKKEEIKKEDEEEEGKEEKMREVKDNNITNDINYKKKIEQIIYVNKYNDFSKKFIRTFFLHCPTGTGKTFIYLLPIFQHISNFNFLEYEMKYLIKNNNYINNSILFDQSKLFYENKRINENVTSFFCADTLKENFFIDYNSRKMNNFLNYLLNKGKNNKIIDKDTSLESEIIKENHKMSNWNNHNIKDLKIKKKNDILIITYNKELAVQIYELHKDIINSFYKSLNSNFFKNNNSLIFPNLTEEKQSLIEKKNVNFKKKININTYLLIGGNNIKYQLKSLKKKKINIINEKEDSTDNNINDDGSSSNKNNHDSNNIFSEDIQNINIYVGTPGRLFKLIYEKKIIKLKDISTVIFDEYDFFFNSFKTSNNKSDDNKIKLENPYFSKILKSIYLNNKDESKINNKKKISYTNVICCSATSAVYSYLTYTKHIITTNFLRNLKCKVRQNFLENGNLQNNSNEKCNGEINNKNKNKNEIVNKKDNIKINNEKKVELRKEDKVIEEKDEKLKKNTSFINYEEEKNMLNELFKINEITKIPENLIHLNYYYDMKDKKKNNAISNFLRILFSNPLNKNVLVFCNTKKKVMDLWSLFRNRFDVDIQTIFGNKEKKKKKIYKDVNYANFFKNDLIDYKNLKKYVNFLFISTNLLYRGINCMGFTTVVNFDMPLNSTEYVHRCGRIGRINNKGAIINIFEKKYKRKYYKEIFNKLNINAFDIDCYMSHIFTLKNTK